MEIGIKYNNFSIRMRNTQNYSIFLFLLPRSISQIQALLNIIYNITYCLPVSKKKEEN